MSDYLAVKLIWAAVIGVAYLLWGIYTGLNGLDLRGRPVQRGQQGQRRPD